MITAKFETPSGIYNVVVREIEYDYKAGTYYVNFDYSPKRYRTTMADVTTVLSDLTDINFNNTKD